MKQQNLAKIFKALANEQRLKIFEMIYHGSGKLNLKVPRGLKCCSWVEKAFTSACDCLDISRSPVSHHFKELQNAGLITCMRKGQTMYCTVNEETVSTLRDFLKD